MPNTATVTDRLPELIKEAWDEIVEALQHYFDNYPEEDCPDWDDLDRDGSLHEIIDSTVPIYNSDLDELAYFHQREALAALQEQFGEISGEWPLGPFAAGLYFLIEEAVRGQWDEEAEDLWTRWQEEMAEQQEPDPSLSAEERNPTLAAS